MPSRSSCAAAPATSRGGEQAVDERRQRARQPHRLRRPLARRRLHGPRRHRARDHLLRERPLVPAARAGRACRAPASKPTAAPPICSAACRIDAAATVERQLPRRTSAADRRAPGGAARLSRRRAASSSTRRSTPSRRRAPRSARTDLAGDARLVAARRAACRSAPRSPATPPTSPTCCGWRARARRAAAGAQGRRSPPPWRPRRGRARPVRRRARARRRPSRSRRSAFASPRCRCCRA